MPLEKVYHRVAKEELWYCMRKSEVAEKYMRVVQDGSETMSGGSEGRIKSGIGFLFAKDV